MPGGYHQYGVSMRPNLVLSKSNYDYKLTLGWRSFRRTYIHHQNNQGQETLGNIHKNSRSGSPPKKSLKEMHLPHNP